MIHYVKDAAQLFLLDSDESSRIEFAKIWCSPIITARNHFVSTRLRHIFQEYYKKAEIALESCPKAMAILSKDYPDKEDTIKMMLVDTATKQRVPCYAHPSGLSMEDFSEISEVVAFVAESVHKKNMQQTVILPIVIRLLIILPMQEETLKGIVGFMNKSRKKDKVTLLSQI